LESQPFAKRTGTLSIRSRAVVDCKILFQQNDWRFITMKKLKMFNSVRLLMAILFILILAPSLEAAAKTKVVAIEGVRYNVNFSLQDNLKSFIGKKVYVTLSSGKTFGGFIKEVGDHFIQLEKLDGKSYFDALIRIEDISAIDTKFRDVQH
jgi:small nuclear ribonucleoprotein (snRNP)-like protein